ncbi:MAG: recombinase family protein [Cyanobacteria bacterium P01_F01_bin.150]
MVSIMGIILGYARVSTEDQAYKVALSNQVERLLNSGCDRVYSDIGSRADDNREGLANVIRDIESGVAEEIRIVALSRLTSSPTTLERLSKIVRDYKVPLTGLDETIDLSSVDGEFTAILQTAFAKREVGTIRLRSARGHQSKKNHSRPNASVPGGYVVVDRKYCLDTRLITEIMPEGTDCSLFGGMTVSEYARQCIEILIDEGSIAKAVKTINVKYDLFRFEGKKRKELKANTFVIESVEDLEKLKVKRFAKRKLFFWTHDNMSRWFRAPVLRGHTPYNTRYLKGTDSAGRKIYGASKPISEWEIHYNTHPDQILLTELEYQQLENRISHNAKIWAFHLLKQPENRYPLSGLLRCAKCGHGMKGCGTKKLKDGSTRRYYQCKGYTKGVCDAKKTAKAGEIQKSIIEFLKNEAHVMFEMPDAVQLKESSEIIELKKQLDGIEKLGCNPALSQAIADLKNQIRNLQILEKQSITLSKQKRTEQLELLEYVQSIEPWEALEPQDSFKKDDLIRIFQWLIDYVEIEDGKIKEIKLNLS